ncbi:MAG TPA: phosphatase PAP2 family protein [Phycisphaerae bacterium]|nr:phosphatase PAP2 family protein [Phycisphaerae bacterium]HPM23455.1 phosphatase PAP2 family protein [Phycisphaerae bacterium]
MPREACVLRRVAFVLCLGVGSGCATTSAPPAGELTVRDAIEHYSAQRADAVAQSAARGAVQLVLHAGGGREGLLDSPAPLNLAWHGTPTSGSKPFLLGTFTEQDASAAQAAPAAASGVALPPEGYWRRDAWHQASDEFVALATHDFWKGFKTSFWDLENALVLTATMGASVTIRETGVDDTIRNRTHGSHALGDLDETIQILGHPGTHFAGTGVLWLTSALTQDVREHEVAKALTQALAVNGVSTLILKGATNTRTPDGEHFGWPSGHASSAFTAAAVLNEFYGPWVGVPSLALAGLVGFQRLDSRVHDFSDVVFGSMMGYIIGTSIARGEKAQFPEIFGMQVIPYVDPETGASGLALLKQW